MKQWMKVGLGALAGVAVIYLVFAIRAKLDNLLLEEPTIHIKVEGESAFLTDFTQYYTDTDYVIPKDINGLDS